MYRILFSLLLLLVIDFGLISILVNDANGYESTLYAVMGLFNIAFIFYFVNHYKNK